MKQFLLLSIIFTFSFLSGQMTEIKSNRKQIGSIESSMSKTKITLERVNNDYYVLSFIDNSYQEIRVPEAVILNETPDTMYSFYKSIFDDFENVNVKEKIFKSGDYNINVAYFGKIPDRHVSLFFQKKNSTKIVVTPFLSVLEWAMLFLDLKKE